MALFGWSKESSAVLLSILVFFIIAIANKWLPAFGVPFNRWFGFGVGILGAFGGTEFISVKVGLITGLIGGLICGIGGAFFFGETESE
jgi:hypothetical protein